jgi:hypothetical protein
MKYWIESSEKETELAAKMAPVILSYAITDHEISGVLLDLVLWFLNGKKLTKSPIVKRIIDENAELLSLDINSPFPLTEQDLSTNFFSNLAFKIRALKYNLPQKGVVATPTHMAFEMAKLATATWVQ